MYTVPKYCAMYGAHSTVLLPLLSRIVLGYWFNREIGRLVQYREKKPLRWYHAYKVTCLELLSDGSHLSAKCCIISAPGTTKLECDCCELTI